MSGSLLKIIAVLFAAVALGAMAAPTRGLARGASSGVGGASSGFNNLPLGSSGVAGPSGSPSFSGKGAPQTGPLGTPSAPGKGAPQIGAGAPPGFSPSSGWKQHHGHRHYGGGPGGPGIVTGTCDDAYYDCGYYYPDNGDCWVLRRIYNRHGKFVGWRRVYVCQDNQ